MRALTVDEVNQVSGGLWTQFRDAAGAAAGALAGGAYFAGELGLASMTVPGIGTALGGFLEAGAAVMGVAAGGAELIHLM